MTAVLSLVVTGLLLGASDAGAVTGPAFEIDANGTGTPPAVNAMYSQTTNDWVDGAGGNGVFKAAAAGATSGNAHADPTDSCYGSFIDRDPATDGVKTLLCDGNSDSKFRNSEIEQSIVSPSGKTLDSVWPITPGNNTSKNDLSHGYVRFHEGDSICDSDTTNDDTFLDLAGHRGDNEGDAFWGYEFNRIKPGGFDDLKDNSGATFNLAFDRQPGDVLVSYSLESGGTDPRMEFYKWVGPASTGTYVLQNPAPTATGCGNVSNVNPLGSSAAATNTTNEIMAPPWNVPACDPTTGDGGRNTCRLAKGSATATSGTRLLPPRDFIESVVDLAAFNITSPCFTSVVFTSRSSSSLTADLKDVAGADVPLCGANISIGPDDVNAVGDTHTFTVNVTKGTGGTPAPAPNTVVTVTFASSNSQAILTNGTTTTPITGATCTTGAAGTCTVTVVSDKATTVTANASATVDVLGTGVAVSTDGEGDNSGPATKYFVDGSVAIAPDDVNEVGESHTFTITATAIGAAGADTPSFTITPSISPSHGSDDVTDCATLTPVNGVVTCDVIVTRATAQAVTVNASTTITWSPSGASLTRNTSAAATRGPGGSGPATKRFVDAFVRITPNGVNGIGEAHQFDVTVSAKPAGTTASFTSMAANVVEQGTTNALATTSNSCSSALTFGAVNTTTGIQTATCSLSIVSNVETIYSASVNMTLSFSDGTHSDTVVRSTDGLGSNSGPATKQYIDGSVAWEKVDDSVPPVHLAGATFRICRTHNWRTTDTPNAGDGAYDLIDPATSQPCWSVADRVASTDAAGNGTTSLTDIDLRAGYLKVDDLFLGTYVISETAAPAGYSRDTTTRTVSISLTASNGAAATPFVNPSLYRVIVLVCKESNNSLYPSSVTFDGATATSKGAGTGATALSATDQAALCAIDGARFTNKPKGDYTTTRVNIQ